MIGVFGGSGFYDFLGDEGREVEVETPYGAPSAALTVGSVDGVEVAFLPRHGRNHQYPPHVVPYRANLWAMKEIGVDRVLGPCAVGSLQAHVAPGHLLIADQLVDRTTGRASTFADGPETLHISFADPYCPELRPLAIEAAKASGSPVHEHGTVVVIQGPRFSTRAESRFFSAQGWEIINMTQAPEAVLARELELCYVNISVVTDYDVGVEGEIEPVSHAQVIERFQANLGSLRTVIRQLIPAAATTPRACPCARARADAVG